VNATERSRSVKNLRNITLEYLHLIGTIGYPVVKEKG